MILNKTKCSAIAMSVTLAFAFSNYALADNTIKGVNFKELPDGKLGVEVTLDHPADKLPSGFTIPNPSRIALDFNDTKLEMQKRSVGVNKGIMETMSMAQGSTRSRLLFNLNKPASYEVSLDSNKVNMVITPTKTLMSAATPAENSAKSLNDIKLINFQSGKENEGKLVIDLSNAASSVDVRQEGQKLIIDFPETSIKDDLLRNLDVKAFKTPINTIKTIKKGNGVRIEIQPHGLWEHYAFQADNKFVLEVKQMKEGGNLPESLSGGKRFTGQKMTLNFRDIPVRDVLQVISDFTKINIIAGDNVNGTISLNLKDVPWDQALDIVLRSRGLGMQKVGNVIWVAPNDDLVTKEKSRLDAEKELSDREPLITQAFQIKYQKASDIQTLISNDKQKMLSSRGSAVIDVSSNTVFVQESERNLSKIQKIIDQVDNPSRQVMIESKIVIAEDNFAKELGSRFGIVSNTTLMPGGASRNNQFYTSGSLASNYNTVANGITTTPGDLNVNLPATMSTAASIGMTLFRLPAGMLLNLELSAAEQDGRSKTVSSPKIITSNQKKATIDSGVQIPYLQASSSGATSVSFKDATLGMDVTPQITPDDKVNMTLVIKKESVGSIYNGVPSINTRKITTDVLVGNGETAVLGGIYEETLSKGLDKVPFFGDLPGVGNLFKRISQKKGKAELIVFITPSIMDKDSAINQVLQANKRVDEINLDKK